MKRKIKDKKQLDLIEEQKRIWVVNARQTAIEIAAREGSVSADDVRERFPIPGGIHRNVMGRLFKVPVFVFSGIKKSDTPSRKGGLICTYRLAESVRNEMEQRYGRRASWK